MKLALLRVLAGDWVELSHHQLDEFIYQNVQYDNSKWLCLICNMSSRVRKHGGSHIEAKHALMPPFLCALCNKPAKTRDSLRKHKANQHGRQQA